MKNRVFFILMTVCLSVAQPVSVERPFSLRLLPGYQQQSGKSLDSVTGTIWKDGGLRIFYDMAGVYTDCTSCGWIEGEEWRKRQLINGNEIVVVFTKSKRLVISFPESHANFYASIGNESDMADMLLMISTFEKGKQLSSVPRGRTNVGTTNVGTDGKYPGFHMARQPR